MCYFGRQTGGTPADKWFLAEFFGLCSCNVCEYSLTQQSLLKMASTFRGYFYTALPVQEGTAGDDHILGAVGGPNGTFVFAGRTSADWSGSNAGQYDCLVIKVDDQGDILWAWQVTFAHRPNESILASQSQCFPREFNQPGVRTGYCTLKDVFHWLTLGKCGRI